MLPTLPSEVTRIATPLLTFCGDSSLGLVLSDRFFRNSPSKYTIEILEDSDLQNQSHEIKQASREKRIMKSSWYEKHTHKQPALCIFCIPIDLNKLSTNGLEWKKQISEQYERIKSYYSKRVPMFIAIFVCPDSREKLISGPIREDQLIREYSYSIIFSYRLNSIELDNMHSSLLFQADLDASLNSTIRDLKNEVFQHCSTYYSNILDYLDGSMGVPPDQFTARIVSVSKL